MTNKVCGTVMISDFAYRELELKAKEADELADALEHTLKYRGLCCHEAYYGAERAKRVLTNYRKSKGE